MSIGSSVIVAPPQQAQSLRLNAGFLLPAFSMCQRELVRFLRQRQRIVGALATPIVFWLLMGGGMGRSFQLGSGTTGSTIHYFFPGTIVMILLFTAIFSTISIIEDRREGFLQSVLVAPVSRMSVVLGKVLGGTVLAAGQGIVFLLLAPLVGFHFSLISFLIAVGVMLIVSFGLTALGFCIAWRMSSTQGFHAIMNLFLMPMWFLSGALFPPGGAWKGLQWLMACNPLTYGLSALRQTLDADHANPGPFGAGLLANTIVSIIFAAGIYLLACVIARKETGADLQ